MPELSQVSWRTSSFSANGGTCVEVGWLPEHVSWRTSSFSANGGDCVEVGWPGVGVAVRDSKNTTGPTLAFPAGTWHDLLARHADR
ncbi:DUF397 domain-containing protein [Actinokineospora sp.]|uniref:DUF397 domain-containing protein n=1 Tax=Actinokineospora sp. TaxID=1872133 RepID=UPI0040378E8E